MTNQMCSRRQKPSCSWQKKGIVQLNKTTQTWLRESHPRRGLTVTLALANSRRMVASLTLNCTST